MSNNKFNPNIRGQEKITRGGFWSHQRENVNPETPPSGRPAIFLKRSRYSEDNAGLHKKRIDYATMRVQGRFNKKVEEPIIEEKAQPVQIFPRNLKKTWLDGLRQLEEKKKTIAEQIETPKKKGAISQIRPFVPKK